MKNKNKIKGKIVGDLWIKESKTGDNYLSGALAAELGGTKITIIQNFSKTTEHEPDYLIMNYDSVSFKEEQRKFKFVSSYLNKESKEDYEEPYPDFSKDELEQWALAKQKASKKA